MKTCELEEIRRSDRFSDTVRKNHRHSAVTLTLLLLADYISHNPFHLMPDLLEGSDDESQLLNSVTSCSRSLADNLSFLFPSLTH